MPEEPHGCTMRKTADTRYRIGGEMAPAASSGEGRATGKRPEASVAKGGTPPACHGDTHPSPGHAADVDATLALAIQEERRRIACQIHDGVSQKLALLLLKVEIITRLADSNPKRMKSELSQMTSVLESCVDELRKLVDSLAPPSSS